MDQVRMIRQSHHPCVPDHQCSTSRRQDPLDPRNNTRALVFVLTSSWMPEKTHTSDHDLPKKKKKRPQTPKKDEACASFRPSPPRCSVSMCALFIFNNLALISCWLVFDFHPAWSQDPLGGWSKGPPVGSRTQPAGKTSPLAQCVCGLRIYLRHTL